MSDDRFDRNERLFGKEGQARIRAATVAVVGIGGLGTHVVQQLALLGVGGLALIDSEELDITNKNRYVGVRHDDPVPGSRKVDLGERLALAIDPTIRVRKVFDTVVTEAGFAAVRDAGYVFGCVDREGVRLILNELCAAYARPYLDLASEVRPEEKPVYGGRMCACVGGEGCLSCLGILDVAEAQRDLAGPSAQRDRDAIYGVQADALGGAGPSVVSINGVVASLAVTEFMAAVTGLRAPCRLLTYHGHTGKVTLGTDQPAPDCYYCKGLRGAGEKADVERYLRAGVVQWLR